MNYICPSEGCKNSKNMAYMQDVINHLKNECKKVNKVCKDCGIEKDGNENHDCVIKLKLALNEESKRASDIETIMLNFLAANKIKRDSFDSEANKLKP